MKVCIYGKLTRVSNGRLAIVLPHEYSKLIDKEAEYSANISLIKLRNKMCVRVRGGEKFVVLKEK